MSLPVEEIDKQLARGSKEAIKEPERKQMRTEKANVAPHPTEIQISREIIRKNEDLSKFESKEEINRLLDSTP